ncbi:hypothetical protein BZA05DRAFT_332771 [Tricharina praecox]|uniref:uncharacterized protein n=1 Tax=Tricharina praecox TaxID=43433 RepID=UPI00221F27BE|nr:uncharacterized protein BZA05DRAFT_332771 [Tricharina praecox]KAI5856510.1 hypothetical protein BZA05DRAFT_332771 [Tricharina praecox]
MKPIGGIVTNKASVPDSLRRLDVFTSEVLSQLWKVYFVNRDVVENGRRLENLFWRLWSIQRDDRPFTGEAVSAMFMRIHRQDDLIPRRIRFRSTRPVDIRTMSERGQPAPPGGAGADALVLTPRISLDIECPPTPPPSPVPNSIQRGFASHSFLSKQPQLTEITLSLQRSLHNPPPSPPVPAPQMQASPPPPSPQRLRPSPSPRQSNPMMTLDTVQESKASEWVSTSFKSEASQSSHSSKTSTTKPAAKAEQLRAKPRRGGKKPTSAVGRANRPRGLAPPMRRSKSSNAAESPVEDVVEVVPPRSLPVVTEKPVEREQLKPPKRKESASSSGGGGWIVDPDFRTKYIDKKAKQKDMLSRVVRAQATTALSGNVVATATSSWAGGKGKGKNVLVVDEVVPLKADDGLPVQPATAPVRPVLPRQKSQLTMLIENARKQDAGGSSKRAAAGGESAAAGTASKGKGKGKGRVR